MFCWFKKKRLKEIGDYEFPEVVLKRTQDELNINDKQLTLITVSLKDFFYAIKAGYHMDLTNKHVDVLWHNFILDTKSYRLFCDDYIGFFIEHIPFLNEQYIGSYQLDKNLSNLKKSAPVEWQLKRKEIISDNQTSNDDNTFLLWVLYLNVISEDSSNNTNYITPFNDISTYSSQSEPTVTNSSSHTSYSSNSSYNDSSNDSSSKSTSSSSGSSCSSCSSCSSGS